MFELKPIARHLLLACGGLASALLVAGPASAQQAQGTEQKLERITITGSNIRRTDTETVAPIEIITREDIEKSGKATVAEVLRAIPANTGNSYSESFSNSFAPGASGIALRGLGQKATLVLLNGRRTAGYGFAQNLQDTFVDLNSLPASAIERIEVLKDGASAIYGSDAIAGVVNVILRKDYKGLEVSGDAGFFAGKNDYRAAIVGGIGDLGADKYNIFATVDFYKRDLVMLNDTDFGASRDKRGEAGGRNFQSLTGAGTWRELNSTATAFTNNFRAISGCTGTVLTAAEAVERGLLAATSAFNLPTNTFCSKDFNYAFTALPETERVSGIVRGTFDASATMQLFGELGYSQVDSFQKFQEPFFAGTTGLNPGPAGLSPFTYNINFAPGASGNPFSNPARYNGVLNDLGTRDTEITSESLRALAGLKLSIAGWDTEAAVGASENEVTATSFNRLSKAGTSAAFGVPTGPFPPTPTSTAPTYNLDNPASNSAAVRNSMIINFPRTAKSELEFVDAKGTTELGTLPGGPIGIALGAEYRSEKLKDRPDPRATGGDILGQGITATDGSRHNLAIYGELALPLTKQLEMQLAMRNDSYSDFGSAMTPKVGLKFRPNAELLLRANWGRGFRAPTLPEISPSVATFFVGVIDPLNPNVVSQVSGVFAGNPNLDAEKSRSTTIGFVYEPTSNLNFSVDWYEINWTNIVGADSFQSIVNNPGDPRVIRDPFTNLIVTVLNNYRNFSDQLTNGVDVDMRHNVRTTFGRFTTRLNASYVNKYEVEGTEFAGKNGFSSIPRWRGTLSLDWEQGAYGLTGRMNYIHSYEQQLLPGSFFVPGDPRFQTGTYPRNVPSHTTFDLVGRWNITPKVSVFASVVNLTDEEPPYDPGFSGTFLYDFTQYSPLGRIFRVGGSYRF